jgi:hypothetical protein
VLLVLSPVPVGKLLRHGACVADAPTYRRAGGAWPISEMNRYIFWVTVSVSEFTVAAMKIWASRRGLFDVL